VDPLVKRVGIVGGGQLGKMMILEGKRLGLYFVILDPTENCPGSSICDEHIIKPFNDRAAYIELSNKVDVVTYEFEHIDSTILQELVTMGNNVYPSPHSLEIIQDKSTQKKLIVKNNIDTPDFIVVDGVTSIKKAGLKFGYPLMLKATTGGYDGKGNARVNSEEDVDIAYKSLGSGSVTLMAERFCPFEKEISVLACRDINGNISIYPVAENKHVNSILDETIVPATISKESESKAMEMAHSVMELFSDVGMFCTEMFVTKSGDVLFNEVAPRPHNSGHYTIEGCFTSQYEAHIRAIVGLPVGDVSLRSPSVMRNILGSGKAGKTMVIGESQILKDPFVKLHIYGKEYSKVNRKMGHITAIGKNIEDAQFRAATAFNNIKIVGV